MYPHANPTSRAHQLAGQWVPVSSSLIAALRWQVTGELDVQFNNGVVHHYDGADAALFDGWLQAPSKGRYYSTVAKANLNYQGHTP